MRILITGHLGYTRAEPAPRLSAAGHDVTGLDAGVGDECDRAPHDVLAAVAPVARQ